MEANFWQDFVEGLVTGVVPGLAALLASYAALIAVPLVKTAFERIGGKMSAETEKELAAKIEHYAHKWVLAAEEAIEGKYKRGVVEATVKGEQKLEMALQGLAEDLPFLNETQREGAVHLALKQLRLGATASSSFLQGELQKQVDRMKETGPSAL